MLNFRHCRQVLALTLALFLCASQARAELPQLTSEEQSQLQSLGERQGELEQQVRELGRQYSGRQAVLADFAEQNEEAILRFSDQFFDYKVDRLAFHTHLAVRLTREAVAANGLSPSLLDEVESLVAEFDENLDKVPRLSEEGLTPAEYKKRRGGNSAAFNSINPVHRKIIDACVELEKRMGDRHSLTGGAWRKSKGWVKDLGLKIGMKLTDKWLHNGLPTLKPVNLVLSSYYRFIGRYSIHDHLKAPWMDLTPAANEVNIIIPPHGTQLEVGLTAGRIAAALPKHRKVAVILAAYHFVPNTPAGFSLAQGMDKHPAFLVVLGDSSPFKVPSENITAQIRRARELGYTDLILFAEGRLPARGGGLTSSSTETFRMLKLLRRQKIKVGEEELPLQATVTLTSGSFTNYDKGIGVGPSRNIHLRTEAFLDAATTQRLAQDEGLFAAVTDMVWHSGAQVNGGRFASAASDAQLVDELTTRYGALTKGCPQQLLTAAEEQVQ